MGFWNSQGFIILSAVQHSPFLNVALQGKPIHVDVRGKKVVKKILQILLAKQKTHLASA